MEFDLSPDINKINAFVGRSAEKARLIDIIADEKGGTLLVAGNRGSGKTTLVLSAIKEVGKLKKLWRRGGIMPFRTTFVSVPLISTKVADEDLRGLIIRSLIHALHAEAWSSPWKLLLGRPVGYLWRLRKLTRQTRYKSIIEKRGYNLNLSVSNSGSALNRTFEAELDLSTINLELRLHDLLLKYSSNLHFIVLFDELDKLHDRTPDDYIYELKNLFTLTYTHFIFTSTEEYFRELEDEKIKLDDNVSVRETIFTHKILINQLSPGDFVALVNKLMPGHANELDFEELTQALMWESDMLPAKLFKILREIAEPGGKILDLEHAARDLSEVWTHGTIMHKILADIYEEFKHGSRGYYDRYLYRALKHAAFSLREMTARVENRYNNTALLFNNEEFVNKDARSEYVNDEHHKLNKPLLTNATWKTRIFDLSWDEVTKIGKAIDELIWRIDRLGLLVIENNSYHFIEYSDTNFSDVYELKEKLKLPTSQERRNKKMIDSLQARLKNADINAQIAKLDLNGLRDQSHSSSLANAYYSFTGDKRDRLHRFVHEDMIKIGEKAEEITDLYSEILRTRLDADFILKPIRFEDELKGTKYIALSSKENKNIIILIDPKPKVLEYLRKFPDIHNVALFTDSGARRLPGALRFNKIFILNKDWANIQTVEKKLWKYLETIATTIN